MLDAKVHWCQLRAKDTISLNDYNVMPGVKSRITGNKRIVCGMVIDRYRPRFSGFDLLGN